MVSLKTKVALPFWAWIIDYFPINTDIYSFFLLLGVFSCVFIILGFKTRFFLIINAICVFYLITTPNFFGKLWHNQLIIWITWFLSFSKCYDVLSVDAMLKKSPVVKSADYSFPIRLIWLQLGVIYFWSGFHKLWDSGFDWALSQSMVNQIQLEWVQHYDKVPDIRIDQFALIHVGGIAVMMFELFYLFFVFNQKWRWFAFWGGLLLHNIIGYFMYIWFFFSLQVMYIFYIDFNKLFSKVEADINSKYSKFTLKLCLSLLGMNFIFGMFGINSYPFSSYPSYSALISDTVKIINFSCPKLSTTVHEVGEKNSFRWEDYGWLENNLIEDFENGVDVQERLENYWRIWATKNPQLQICDSIYVSILKRPVSPEGIDSIEHVSKMGVIYINK